MGQTGLDKHQLAGLDDRERGFSRPIELERIEEQYRAALRYESSRVTTDPHLTQDLALHALIETLQAQGYRQLRTQLSFRNGAYLGSHELWIEYADPPDGPEPRGLLATIAGWFQPRRTDRSSQP
jgi:hypothetical protein